MMMSIVIVGVPGVSELPLSVADQICVDTLCRLE